MRSMHPLPCRYGEGRQAAAGRAVGCAAAAGSFESDDGCLDLRAGAGSPQSGPLRPEVFPRGGSFMKQSVRFTLDGKAVEAVPGETRSEEHTSELQSRGQLVCCLLHDTNIRL